MPKCYMNESQQVSITADNINYPYFIQSNSTLNAITVKIVLAIDDRESQMQEAQLMRSNTWLERQCKHND